MCLAYYFSQQIQHSPLLTSGTIDASLGFSHTTFSEEDTSNWNKKIGVHSFEYWGGGGGLVHEKHVKDNNSYLQNITQLSYWVVDVLLVLPVLNITIKQLTNSKLYQRKNVNNKIHGKGFINQPF